MKTDTVVNLKFDAQSSTLYIQLYQRGGLVYLHKDTAPLGDKVAIAEELTEDLINNCSEVKEQIKKIILENYNIKVNRISDFKFGVYYYLAKGRGKVIG